MSDNRRDRLVRTCGWWEEAPYIAGAEEATVNTIEDLVNIPIAKLKELARIHQQKFPHVHTGWCHVRVMEHQDSLFTFVWRDGSPIW